jgi:Ala-tRNA(Pro) deacylase
MPINPKLLAYLTAAGARYQVFPHRLEYTAQEVAEASHVAGRELIKAVVLKDERSSYLVAALPACAILDLERLARLAGRARLSLASEHELRLLFPDCSVGCGPPFGQVYGISVIVDPCLLESDEIYFQAGGHREIVRMSRGEFLRVASPLRAAGCFHTAEPAHGTGGARSTARAGSR